MCLVVYLALVAGAGAALSLGLMCPVIILGALAAGIIFRYEIRRFFFTHTRPHRG